MTFTGSILSILPPMIVCHTLLHAQVIIPPYSESFDTLRPGSLPPGWSSSANRKSSGDIVVSEGSAYSGTMALLSTNATTEQWVTTPPADLSERRDCVLRWVARRSATHDATVHVESSVDGGATFGHVPGGLLVPDGETGYTAFTLALGPSVEGVPDVVFRWRIAADGTGQTGTIRIDDVVLEGRARYDAAAGPAVVLSSHPRLGSAVEVSCPIFNAGYETIRMADIGMFIDSDGDGRAGPGEFHSSCGTTELGSGDSAECSFTIVADDETTALVFVAGTASDGNNANDTAYLEVLAGPAASSVIINEIMYDPLPGRAEYVEILNVTDRPVDLRDWRLTDREDDSARGAFGPTAPPLGPGEFALCSADTSVMSDYSMIPQGTIVIAGLRGLSLNNGGDLLSLTDATGYAIDRVAYSPAWHASVLDGTGGRSLERIDPSSPGSEGWNWGSSADPAGGTPGRRNSLFAEVPPSSGALSFDPNPFSPDGDGVGDVIHLRYRHPGKAAAVIRVRIYDTGGNLVRTLTSGTYVSREGTVVWNGFDDRGRKCPIGVYIVLLEGVDGDGTEVFSEKGVVVVAGKL